MKRAKIAQGRAKGGLRGLKGNNPALRLVDHGEQDPGHTAFTGPAASRPVEIFPPDRSRADRGGAATGSSKAQPALPALTEALGVAEQRLSRLMEERERLGRELQACVVEPLHALGVSLDRLRCGTPDDSSQLCGYAEQAGSRIKQLMREIRQVIRGLEAEDARGFDLEDELRTVMNEYREFCRPRFRLVIDPAAPRLLTSEERRYVVAMAREAIGNSLRHADADNVLVTLRRLDGRLRVDVRDDGIGIGRRAARRMGMGLSTLAARATQLGGRVSVRPLPRRGTQVVLVLPLEAAGAVRES